MDFRTKKILIVIVFVLFVFGVGYLLWSIIFRAALPPEEVSPPITPDSEITSELPSSLNAGERVVEEPIDEGGLPPELVTEVAIGGKTETESLTLRGVSDVVLGADGKSLNYYDPQDGKFYNVDDSGNKVAIFNEAFLNAENIDWAGDSTKAIVEFPDGANVMVDLTTGTKATLPSHWEDFDFSPNSQQIVAKSIGIDPSNRWLVIADPNGGRAETIAALGNNYDKVTTSWSPNDQVVAFSDTGVEISGFGRKQMLAVGKHQENFPGIIVEGLFFDPIWNDTGSQILYSTAGPSSNYQPQVWLTNGNSDSLGGDRKSVALNTWAHKCTYASDNIAYCAVPQRLPENSGLQPVLATGIPDSIYMINTKTGSTTLVGEPDTPTSMTNLNVSDDGSVLFFQNEFSGTLKKMQLK